MRTRLDGRFQGRYTENTASHAGTPREGDRAEEAWISFAAAGFLRRVFAFRCFSYGFC